jgi:hypothetical protein
MPNLREQRRTPCGTFDGKNLNIVKPGIVNFGSQLLRTVKVGGREVCWVVDRIPMLAGGEISRHDFAKLLVSKETARKPVDQGGEPTDRGGEKDAVWFEHSVGFTRRALTIRVFD